MNLLELPTELLEAIANELEASVDLYALARTCKHLFDHLILHLYRHNARFNDSSVLEWAIREDRPSTLQRAVDAGIARFRLSHLSLAASLTRPSPGIFKMLLESKDVIEELQIFGQDSHGESPLGAAAAAGRLDLVEILLDFEDVNSKNDGERDSALTRASASGHSAVVKLLLERGADPNAKARAYGTALSAAVETGHLDVIERLLAGGADINASGTWEHSALWLAARDGDVRVVELLLNSGADPNVRPTYVRTSDLPLWITMVHKDIPPFKALLNKGAEIRDDRGVDLALHHAAENEETSFVRLLLAKGVGVNARDCAGKTPLHFAVKSSQADNVRTLLENGADPSALDDEGEPPIFHANAQILEILLDYQADIDVSDLSGNTLLHSTTDLEFARTLIKKGADVKAKNLEGVTPLHSASKSTPELVSLLIQSGADSAACDDQGDTPLHFAVTEDGPETLKIIEILLEAGADVTVKNCMGETPLILAASESNFDVLRLLVESGADVNEEAYDSGVTPLVMLSNRMPIEAVQFLLDKGADPNITTEDGLTPVIRACSMWSQEDGLRRVVLLLKHGASATTTTSDGRSPLFIAAMRGFTDIMSLLHKHGADVNQRAYAGNPLLVADRLKTVEWLLQHGADPNVAQPGEIGETPLMRAVRLSRHPWSPQMAEVLLLHGADVHAVDRQGSNLLHWSTKLDSCDAVRFFVEKGVSADAADNAGRTPLYWAALKRNSEMVSILNERGARLTATDKTLLEKESSWTSESLARLLEQQGSL